MNFTMGNMTDGRIAKEFQLFIFIYTGIILTTGLLANSVFLSFCICSGSRRTTVCSSTYYLIAIGFSDLCVIAVLLLTWLDKVAGVAALKSAFICKVATFVGYTGSFLCPWFIAQLTIERFLVVQFPLLRQTIISVARTRWMVFGTTLIGIGCNAWFLRISTTMTYKRTVMCAIEMEYREAQFWFEVYNVVAVFTIPMLTLLVVNIWIAIVLVRRIRRGLPDRRDGATPPELKSPGARFSTTSLVSIQAFLRKRQAEVKTKLSIDATDNGFAPRKMLQRGSLVRNHSRISLNPVCQSLDSSRHRSEKQNNRENRAAAKLIIVSIMYLALNLPMYAVRLHAYVETGPQLNQYFTHCAYLLFTTQYCLHCFAYARFASLKMTLTEPIRQLVRRCLRLGGKSGPLSPSYSSGTIETRRRFYSGTASAGEMEILRSRMMDARKQTGFCKELIPKSDV